MSVRATTTVLAALVGLPLALAAHAQPAPAAREIPQSLRVEHDNTLQQLMHLARRPGPVGVAARDALALFKQHIQREEAYILPPLTLLPLLADGKVSPDMRWAIDMADRVRKDREEIFIEHTRITDAMNALAAAAQRTRDTEALDFAQGAVADSLNDVELLEPMCITIGDYLRAKLPVQ
jgi:hypothetical protein